MPTEKEKKQMATPPGNSDAITIVSLVGIGLAAIVLILIFRPDSDPVVTSTSVGAFIAAILAYLKNQQTHILVNSRSSEALETAENKGFLRGLEEGRKMSDARTDKLAKEKK